MRFLVNPASSAERERRTSAFQIVQTGQSIGLARRERGNGKLRLGTPHLTLARIKGVQNLVALRQAIAQLPSAEFGVSTAAKFLLYQSEPGERSSVYKVIGEFPL